jgi:hypothetical protein
MRRTVPRNREISDARLRRLHDAAPARKSLLQYSLASDAASSTGTASFGDFHLQESNMPRGDKSLPTDKQQHQVAALEKGEEPKGVARPKAEARAWAAANKLHGGGKNVGSRRKVPFGPVGGSGRKTNLARSS